MHEGDDRLAPRTDAELGLGGEPGLLRKGLPDQPLELVRRKDLHGATRGLAGARQPCFGFIQFEPVEAQARTRQIRFHRGTKHRSLHSGWIKGLATPGAPFRGGGRKGTRVPGLPWRGRRDHGCKASRVPSALPLRRGTPLLCAAC